MQKDIFKYCYKKYGDLFGDSFNEKLVFDAFSLTLVAQKMISPVMKFYRIRKNLNEQREDISNPVAFSYPDAKFCTENGRAHIYGYPAFYCSDTMKVAVSEVRPEQDDLLYICEWNTNSVCQVRLCIIASDKSMKNSVFSEVQSFIYKQSEDIESGEEIRKWLSIREQITKLFLEEFHPYANSSVYSYMLMYLFNVDMIVYPSFQWDDTLTNLAIKKEYVDKYLRLKKVYKVQMTADSKSVSTLSLRQVGKANLNEVTWSPPEQSDFDDFVSKFVIDKGTFAIRMPMDQNIHKIRDILKDLDCKLIKTSIQKYSKNDMNKSMKLCSLGLKQIQSGNYYEALKHFDQCIALCTFMPSFYYHRGLCNFYITKYDDAIMDYSNAIRLGELYKSDSTHKAYCNRGTIYQHQKQYDKAMSDFTRAIEIAPGDDIAILNMANCLLEMGRIHEALLSYEDALKLKPKDEKIIRCRDYALKLQEKA
jgi:tetratricopeptide (TPR) repeat protein